MRRRWPILQRYLSRAANAQWEEISFNRNHFQILIYSLARYKLDSRLTKLFDQTSVCEERIEDRDR